MRILCLTHVPFEGPARIQAWAKSRAHELLTIRADLYDAVPEVSSAEMLVVMGGPMSVNDSFPWLRREAAIVEACLRANKPTLGVCLGAQLLAQVLGSRVFASEFKEIGWWEVVCCESSPTISHPLPHGLVPLHWHGETFDLPTGAQPLARSEAIENQAFVANGNAVGLQFHIEATPESVEQIVEGANADIDGGPWQQTAETILLERFIRANNLQSTCFAVLDWLIAGPAE